MRRVLKYPLEITDRQFVDSFADWKPLSVDIQHSSPCLWAEVDDESGPARWRVFVHGTGHYFEHQGRFVGTFQLPEIGFVGHVYAESDAEPRVGRS